MVNLWTCTYKRKRGVERVKELLEVNIYILIIIVDRLSSHEALQVDQSSLMILTLMITSDDLWRIQKHYMLPLDYILPQGHFLNSDHVKKVRSQ